MKKLLPLLTSLLLFASSITSAQTGTVNVFIHQCYVGPGLKTPDHTWIDTAYANHFATVNLTQGLIPSVVGSLNGYDAVWISEWNIGPIDSKMSVDQQQVVEDYLQQGGHVVWMNEKVFNNNTHQETTIQNVYGLNVTKVAQTDPLSDSTISFHPTAPMGLNTGVSYMLTTSSSDKYLGPPAIIDNMIWATRINTCDPDSIVAITLFFPGPYICDFEQGTLLVTGEILHMGFWQPSFDVERRKYLSNIAYLHKVLVSRDTAALSALNSNFVPNPVCPHTADVCEFIILDHELSRFEADLINSNTAQLYWQVGEEQDVAVYGIEQAVPGTAVPDFEEIGQVAADGSTQYQHEVPSLASGTHYFRLKLWDEQGSFSYSDVRAVTVAAAQQPFLCYPTFIDRQSCRQLYLQVAQDSEVEVQLYSVLGQQLQTLYSGPLRGQITHQLEVDFSSCPAGGYVLLVKSPLGLQTQQIALW